MRVLWNHWSAGGELRFQIGRYRSGGPWITRRVVHGIASRYGVEFRWRGQWRFLGLLVLEGQRTEYEADGVSTTEQPPILKPDAYLRDDRN